MSNQPLEIFYLNGFCWKQVNPLSISKEAFDPILTWIACKVFKLGCFKVLAFFLLGGAIFDVFSHIVCIFWSKSVVNTSFEEHKKLYLSETK